MDVLLVGSRWLHLLATVIYIGQAMLLPLVYIPFFKQRMQNAELGAALEEINRRSRLWMGLALLVFIATGVYLLLIDDAYLGVGNFGNTWSALMLIKHILIVGLVAAYFYLDRVVLPGVKAGKAEAGGRLNLVSGAVMIAGAVILLLTALAEAA